MWVPILRSVTECVFYCEPCQRLKGIVLVERALQFTTLGIRCLDLALTLAYLLTRGGEILPCSVPTVL